MNNWMVALVQTMLTSVSGPMRQEIVKSIQQWEIKAKETKSPWDDILVGAVKWLLAIP